MRLHPLPFAALALLAGAAFARLPPLSDEARAKAAEGAARTAWADKVAAFQTCKAMDKAVTNYEAEAKKAGRQARPGGNAPACTDPGPFAPPATPAAASGAKS